MPDVVPLEAVFEGTVVESSGVGEVIITRTADVQVDDLTISEPTEEGLYNPVRVSLEVLKTVTPPSTFTFFGSRIKMLGQDCHRRWGRPHRR
ncbi:MAG: hypothetical protein HYU36_11345 [Planctomycetes bacterium]|nr:hypothetical protein [Planctomycetota bacterium]